MPHLKSDDFTPLFYLVSFGSKAINNEDFYFW